VLIGPGGLKVTSIKSSKGVGVMKTITGAKAPHFFVERFNGTVAFAGTLPEPFDVVQSDETSMVFDQAFLLQIFRDDGYACAPNSQHLGELLVRQTDILAVGEIAHSK
jgi:hypothetical protein